VICVLSLGLYPRLREPRATAASAPAPELREGETPGRVGGSPARSTPPYGDTPTGRRR
jgi:putative amide transporter protein